MEEITTYTISKLQSAFASSADQKDYLFVPMGKEPIYAAEPFRAENFSIAFLREGELNFQAGLTSHFVQAPALITIGPSVTRSFKRSDQKPGMELIFFKEAFLVEQQSDVFFLNKFPFFEDNDHHVISPDEQTLVRLQALYSQIANCVSDNLEHEHSIMRNLIYVLIYYIDGCHRQQKQAAKSEKVNPLFQRFRNMLIKEFVRHRSVNYYAAALNVTPKYLSRVVKDVTGQTAGEWIDKAVLLEAKVLLQNKHLNISEISDHLNFSDQSFFGKYFKNLEGVSPLDYRKSHT
ncbi:helix-turn-helix domain-containing protein [Pedobacter ginsengisoli]|uniref:helix-turn-helix domain-containing protein n=1 Tax=Pedobacter ginsengisoli TaxID=363852 RepID=UPI00254C0DB3|nr:helix-turn-helix domain-containing protein [Pedobacter ginsengisoli]